MYCCVFSSSTIEALGNIVRTTLSVILAIAADGAIDKCIMLMCRCALFCVVPAGGTFLAGQHPLLILESSLRADDAVEKRVMHTCITGIVSVVASSRAAFTEILVMISGVTPSIASTTCSITRISTVVVSLETSFALRPCLALYGVFIY